MLNPHPITMSENELTIGFAVGSAKCSECEANKHFFKLFGRVATCSVPSSRGDNTSLKQGELVFRDPLSQPLRDALVQRLSAQIVDSELMAIAFAEVSLKCRE
jgi:hypothetical protein